MFPDLLTYAPTLQAEFHLSLPQDLLTSLHLLLVVDAFEELTEWVYQTAATLSADFKANLELLGYPLKCCFRRHDSLLWRLPPEHPAHGDLDRFLTHLETTPAETYQRVLLLNLARDAGEPVPSIDPDQAALDHMLATVRRLEREKWGRTLVDHVDEAELIALTRAPRQLKGRILDLLTQFWENHYRQEFAVHHEAMARSVAHHRQQHYPRNFTDLFRQVTGRAPSGTVRGYLQEHLEKMERIIFCPCAHLGLYFQLALSHPILVVAYNYRTTPAHEKEGAVTAELFPPLKALADESRLHILALLQGREMYAQEIVEAIGLSQSTISRHLQLLERTEVVSARQERGMKFYSIDREKGRALLDALRHLIG